MWSWCLPSSIRFLKLFPLLHTPCPCTHFPPLCKKIKEKMAQLCPSVPLLLKAGAMPWQGHSQPAPHHPCTARLPEAELVMVTPTAVLEPQLWPWWLPRRSERHLKVTSKTTSRAFRTGNMNTAMPEISSFLRLEVLDIAVLWEISVLRNNYS